MINGNKNIRMEKTMIRKIVSSIIIIMIICSTYVFANNTVPPEHSTEMLPEQENSGASDNSGNVNTDNNVDNDIGADSDTSVDTNTDINTDTNTEIETDQQENLNQDSNNNINNDNNDKSEPIIQQPENNQGTSKVEATPSRKPTQSNLGTTENSDNETKSSEARLKELQIDIEGITPEFDKNTTEYYLVVDLSVEQIKVKAIPQDDKAKVSILGSNKLQEGENTISINVTAEDGTIKTYYIYVTKVDDVEMANTKLEILEIEGFNLYPSFKSDIYTYNLNIDKDIKELNINAKPEREKATVQIIGNTNLNKGENMIEIKVTAEDGITIRTYKINTYINADKVKIETESKLPAIILIVVLGLGIIALGIYIFIKNKK